MAKHSIHQPHDKLFKLSLTRRASAYDFLKSHAPPQLLAEIDIETLSLTPAGFVTKKYKDLASDVVYTVHTRYGEGYVCLLLEHQTEEDKEMPLRLLEYTTQLMRLHLKQHGGKLPEVYSLVVYTGEKPYQGPRTLDKAFVKEGAMARMGTHCFLVDLARIDDTELLQDGEVALAELTLKEGRKDPIGFLKARGKLINASADGEAVLLYLFAHIQQDRDKKVFIEEVGNLAPERKEYIMNAIQQIRQEGMQRGIRQVALNLRKQGISPSIIKKATGVDPKDLDSKAKKQ